MTDKVQASPKEGAGYKPIPRRDIAHADPDWFETGKDEDINDPDDLFLDPLPAERHRRIP
jgi:hypothetical protein